MKYRVWDKVKRRFADNIVLDKDGDLIEFYQGTSDWTYLTPGECVDRYLISMCSLRKDEREQYIYEGDLVRIDSERPLYTVTYEEGKFLLQNDENAVLHDLYEFYPFQLKKVGNIYQN